MQRILSKRMFSPVNRIVRRMSTNDTTQKLEKSIEENKVLLKENKILLEKIEENSYVNLAGINMACGVGTLTLFYLLFNK